jgi:hypothetical protein
MSWVHNLSILQEVYNSNHRRWNDLSVDPADVTCIVITGKIRIPRLMIGRDKILYASMLGAIAFKHNKRM